MTFYKSFNHGNLRNPTDLLLKQPHFYIQVRLKDRFAYITVYLTKQKMVSLSPKYNGICQSVDEWQSMKISLVYWERNQKKKKPIERTDSIFLSLLVQQAASCLRAFIFWPLTYLLMNVQLLSWVTKMSHKVWKLGSTPFISCHSHWKLMAKKANDENGVFNSDGLISINGFFNNIWGRLQ